MVQKTVRPSDRMAIAAVIDPDANAVGTINSGWIDMSVFNEIMAVVMTGVLGAAATLDAKLEQATDATGTGVKDVTGAAITQMTKAANDDNQSVINLWAEDLDVDNNFTHVRLSITIAGATSDAGAVVLGTCERYGPASANDLASVVEIV